VLWRHLVIPRKWSFFRFSAFSAGFRLRRTRLYASAKTLVRPCQTKKLLISGIS
jgi:hypothetical protein